MKTFGIKPIHELSDAKLAEQVESCLKGLSNDYINILIKHYIISFDDVRTTIFQESSKRYLKLMKDLSYLTPSGSEYVNNPKRCLEYIETEIKSTHNRLREVLIGNKKNKRKYQIIRVKDWYCVGEFNLPKTIIDFIDTDIACFEDFIIKDTTTNERFNCEDFIKDNQE
jgi:hypothetical protein